MSKKVTIGSIDYVLPTEGTSPTWGEDLSAIIEALIAVANAEQGPSDILESSANIANTGTFPAQISGFYFDPSTVRSFVSEYNISRKITKSLASTSGTGTVVTINTIGDHYLKIGDPVTLTGTIGLAGTYTVTSTPTSTSFEFAGTYVGNDTISVYQVELLESGTIYGNHGLEGWHIAITNVGNSRAVLDIDSLGNLTYNPEPLVGSGYVGSIRFMANAILNS